MDAEGCDVAELECGEETGVGAQLLLLRVWGGGGEMEGEMWSEGGGKEVRSEGGGGEMGSEGGGGD